MADINFSIQLDLSNLTQQDYPYCFVTYYGIKVKKDCIGTGADMDMVVNWYKQCNIIPDASNNTFNFTITPTEQEANQCGYELEVITIPCCALGISDCNTPYPDTPILVPGQYSLMTIPLKKSYTSCRRYFIGVNGAALTLAQLSNYPVTVFYTPCYETNDALCNNWDYDTNPQSITIGAGYLFNGVPGTGIDANFINNILSNPAFRYIEICSQTPPELYYNDGTQVVLMQPGVDYGVFSTANHTTYNSNGSIDEYTNQCCHECKQYVVCNLSGTNWQAIIQDCQDGLLKIVKMGSSGLKTKCLISGHLFSTSPTTPPFNINSGSMSGAINVQILNDCNTTPNLLCRDENPI